MIRLSNKHRNMKNSKTLDLQCWQTYSSILLWAYETNSTRSAWLDWEKDLYSSAKVAFITHELKQVIYESHKKKYTLWESPLVLISMPSALRKHPKRNYVQQNIQSQTILKKKSDLTDRISQTFARGCLCFFKRTITDMFVLCHISVAAIDNLT